MRSQYFFDKLGTIFSEYPSIEKTDTEMIGKHDTMVEILNKKKNPSKVFL